MAITKPPAELEEPANEVSRNRGPHWGGAPESRPGCPEIPKQRWTSARNDMIFESSTPDMDFGGPLVQDVQ